MRFAFIASYAANAVLALLSLAILPDRVAIHFGPGGRADSWAPAYINAVIFVGLQTFLFIAFLFLPRLVLRFPAKWINLPNRQFWLASENRALARVKLAELLYSYGCALFAFLFSTALLTLKANLSDPVRLDEKYFLILLALFFLYTFAWCGAFFRSFRIPEGKEPGQNPP